MKLFIFQGEGITLGCTIIVKSKTKKEAIELMKQALKKEGLD